MPGTFAASSHQESPRQQQQQDDGDSDSDSMAEMGYAKTPTLPMGKTLTSTISPKLDKLKLLGRYHSLPRKLEDDYEVSEKVLGSGFSGDVRLCSAIDSGQRFAVKTLDMAHATPVVWAKMQSELRVSLCVDHPHLVRLINVYEAEDSFSLVMELLEGGTLAESMKEGQGKPEPEAAQITKQLLLAISYLHSHGIVHRDLKPENFVYQTKSNKHLKMIDFGFSKFRDDQDMLLSRCGSPAFAAPEIFAGKGYTNQVDMWSLGVIVFNLLVGYLPSGFAKGSQKANRMNANCRGLSAKARDFTKQMMQQNADERITVFNALQHPWLVEHGCAESSGGESKIDGSMVMSLQSYGSASKLRRCFLSAVAKTISDEQVSKIREAFVSLDSEKNGMILGRDVGTTLINAGTPKCDVETIVSALDVDKDGEIDFSEFMAAALSATPDFSDECLRLAFRNFDITQTGRITMDNLREVLGEDFGDDEGIPDTGLDFEGFSAFMRQPTQALPKPLHGPLKKLRGSSSADPRRASLVGFRDAFAYHERYVVVSRLQIRWWRREEKSSDGAVVAQRIVDFSVNDVEVSKVNENPSRFILRNKNGAWEGDSLDSVELGRDFVFDTAGSQHSCDEWMDTIRAHAKFAQERRSST